MGRPPLITNNALLAAAREVFSHDGLSATIKDVAERLGVSEAAIFKRYPTKSELVVAAMVPPLPDMSLILDPLDDIDDIRGALSQVMRSLLAHMRETLPLVLPLISQPDIGLENIMRQSSEPAVMSITAALAKRFGELRERGDVSPVDGRAAAGLMVATAHSLVLFEIMGFHGGTIPPQGVEAMLDALWIGLCPQMQAEGEQQ
ncbi:MAG: TetR/AcrR family transcriptional regulator [Salaquimonas sp.]|jgi:AcrR family transcriptional regulator|nr:TetR/AcrR family transcriptional regulator [Salaquimonas sp.]